MRHARETEGERGPEPSCPELPDPERVDPEVLTALLARHGWRRRGGGSGRYTRWTEPGAEPGGWGGTRTSLLVPAARDFADYADLVGEALTALARSGAPSARSVLLALSVPGDEIRWSREVPAVAGAVPWTAADRLRSGARGMLRAAAQAARGSGGYFGARHARHADAYLGRVLLGPSSGGVLTAYTPAPDGRAVAVTLLRSLRAARDAADYERITGGLEAFDVAIGLGVCHELIESVIALVRDAEGVRIALEWSPAAGPPVGAAARPEPVEFSPGDLPALKRASESLTRGEPPLDVELTGAVVRLSGECASGGGTVGLRVLGRADVGQVRLWLDEEAYRIAAHAHLAGLPLRVRGRLESRGGFRRLTGATAVAPVELDEAERDRLLKSLHGGVDSFDDGCGA